MHKTMGIIPSFDSGPMQTSWKGLYPLSGPAAGWTSSSAGCAMIDSLSLAAISFLVIWGVYAAIHRVDVAPCSVDRSTLAYRPQSLVRQSVGFGVSRGRKLL
ncbi:uncharacterized protein B0I36DRAFT_344458 [Microdochium trichocladiopsis]|uniref:Uncharacterized protein n=1 Tax=Microdochium trichocladiopsis TaxID=1682393 RepID=A0A9P8YJW0_9PEZI|nr:uncharacterized protein B0I36DRAFT_344458 [Microdochium trichocladiopsis]KAH7040771.1 hypothetical protein B0I36DRAFT_344458 [Microdochium trichocladiopsis]